MATAVLSDVPQVHLHIGGVPQTGGSGGTHDHLHPVTQQVQATIPLAGRAEVASAVERAEAVRESWRRTSPEQRRDILNKLADLMVEHRTEFARMAALDGGTTISVGERGVDTAVAWVRYYAGWCDKLTGEMLGTFDTRGEFAYSVPEPIGIVGIIITWNGPLISLGMKVAAALAAGNCVICKPAEMTPFAPELFARLCRQAGLPDGVLSIFPGTGEAGDAIVRHKKVRKISFTGGPITARKILEACAQEIKPSVMELGGKSASLVFPDCDLQAAAERAVFWTVGCLSGQGCALPTRQLVHADVYDEFVERLKGIIGQFKVGDPMDPTVMVGPVINKAATDRIMGMFERAKADKAGKFLLGGNRCGGDLADGNFIEPTLIVDADPDHEISQVEIFGPAVVVMKFHTEDEAVAIANNSEYGLAAYIQSDNVQRVHRLSERLSAGGVYVNGGFQVNPHTPFGGIGISGFGKEGGKAGIDEFLHYKTVVIGVGAPIFG
ncbi:aldehyde dehydrogenase family protein [Novosphingobium sp. KCTC 2891]|uniref:aldehyde dehydrogenase family protein n=1 Tax=Novosphingobium sp. KCTC 2891 TaxID=2989730 RepID=UPI002222A44E|nr:aldehyde dehydrogenase family protein [Novosphingobium sp. KCTC 2891]MCW1383648.1 aldehyde dehydrogenase family protein [Novosphingobium sp. KCTC 2891]